MRLSKNFTLKELRCKCNSCIDQVIDKELIEKLQQLRDIVNKPIKVNSGYRCSNHNKSVGGVSSSQHCLGKAADIVIRELLPEQVAMFAEEVGFNGIGVYDTFTHVDVREQKARWGKETVIKEYLPDGPSEEEINNILDELEEDEM